MPRGMAPQARGRGWRVILASVFCAVLVSVPMFVTPIVASAKPKTSEGDKAAKQLQGAATIVVAGATGKARQREISHAVAKKPRVTKAARKAPSAKARRAKRTAAVLGKSKAKSAKAGRDGVASKELGDKNSGPCTRHVHKDGKGHDFHVGYGWGHYGKAGAIEPPAGDGDDGTPPTGGGVPGGETPGNDPPAGGPTGSGDPGGTPGSTSGPFLPFTISTVAFKRRTAGTTAEAVLPFTGSDSKLLLAIAALAALMGGALRMAAGMRLHGYMRVAR